MKAPSIASKANSVTQIARRATRLTQPSGTLIYQFALTGEELLKVADISRISRDDVGRLIGYQRPEVKSHVHEIVEYLDGNNVIFPHAVIIALSSRVKFTSSRGPQVDDGISRCGTIYIPIPKTGEPKPGWIVDGQQRVLAVSKSSRINLPIPVCAFVTDDVEVQREQFLRINNVKPLPKGLVEELLPEVGVTISSRTSPNKLPSELVSHLNRNSNSPFYGLIKRSSSSKAEREKAVVSDGPLIRATKQSLYSTAGSLFPYRNAVSGEIDTESIWKIVVSYWGAVRDTFPGAWGRSAKESRLMHSVGIISMGRLMDVVMAEFSPNEKELQKQVVKRLEILKDVCCWTQGKWEGIGLQWDHLENIPRHQSILTNFLVRTYVEARNSREGVT